MNQTQAEESSELRSSRFVGTFQNVAPIKNPYSTCKNICVNHRDTTTAQQIKVKSIFHGKVRWVGGWCPNFVLYFPCRFSRQYGLIINRQLNEKGERAPGAFLGGVLVAEFTTPFRPIFWPIRNLRATLRPSCDDIR